MRIQDALPINRLVMECLYHCQIFYVFTKVVSTDTTPIRIASERS